MKETDDAIMDVLFACNRSKGVFFSGRAEYHKIGKGGSRRKFDLMMFWLLATKAIANLFDDPAIEAQTTRRKQMMTINQIGMQTPQQAIRSNKSQKRTQVQPAFEDSNPLGEADAVRVQSRGSGCLERESTHGIMGQQEGIEFLQNKDGQFAPQGLTAQTLVILDLINGQLNFPTLMVEHAQITGRIQIRIEQGGDKPMNLANIGIDPPTGMSHTRGGNLFQTSCDLLLDGVLDDAYCQGLFQTWILFGQQCHQITAVWQNLLLVGIVLEGQTTQQMGPMIEQGLQKAHRDEATIHQDEHPGFNGAQESLRQTLLRGEARSDHQINNGVGANFCQIHTMQLRERAPSPTRTTPTKIGRISWRVSHIFIGPIQSHQTQTKGKRSRRFRQSQRFAFEHKEAAKDLDSNLLASIHPSPSSRELLWILLCQIAFRATQLSVNGSQCRTQEQAPADQHVDHDRHRQLACSGRLVMKRGDQFFYRFPIIEAFQDRQTKGLTQLVMTWQLCYGKRHEGPPSDNSCDFFLSVCQIEDPSVCLFERYCPKGAGRPFEPRFRGKPRNMCISVSIVPGIEASTAMHCPHAQMSCIVGLFERIAPLVRTFAILAMSPKARSKTERLEASSRV